MNNLEKLKEEFRPVYGTIRDNCNRDNCNADDISDWWLDKISLERTELLREVRMCIEKCTNRETWEISATCLVEGLEEKGLWSGTITEEEKELKNIWTKEVDKILEENRNKDPEYTWGQ